MPRARCKESVEAEKLYHSGRKLIDIAREIGVPDSTVRRWKSNQNWDKNAGGTKKKESERSDSKPKSKANARKPKRGGQPGNKNAKGAGAPPGNVNAATHGAYINFYKKALADDDIEALPILAIQRERDRLQMLYAQHQITERGIMEKLLAIENGAEMLTLKSKSEIEPTGKKNAEGKEITKVVKISQEQVARNDTIKNFTLALTRVRAEMRRTADSLRQLDEAEAKTKTGEDNQTLLDAMEAAFNKRGGSGRDE